MTRVFVFLVLSFFATSSVAQNAAQAAAASLRFLDRTTGVLEEVKLGVGQAIEVGALRVTLLDCRYPVRAINRDAFAQLQVVDTNSETMVFEGWMVASSPALNALEYPRYDVWVLRCRTS